jgi:hypothetical protein
VITHGTPGDWIAWAFMLAMSLVAARLCFRRASLAPLRLVRGEEEVNVLYAAMMFVFLLFAFLFFVHAPFHVKIS